MKPSLTYTHHSLLGLACAVALLASACSAKAQVLLTVNVSDPDAVTITATGASPSTSASTILADGVDLLNFFQNGGFTPVDGNFPNYGVPATSLTTGDLSAGPLFTQASGDNASASNVDLNLYQNNTGDTTMTFTPGDAAFSGTLTLTMVTDGVLPTAGESGAIVAGFSNSGTTTIGEWQAVTIAAPEPSTWALAVAGVSLVVVGRSLLKRLKLQAMPPLRKA